MKTVKRLFTAALTVLFALACALPALAEGETPAAPANGYTLTINNPKPDHIYEAYQIFQGNISYVDNACYLADITWGSGVQESAALLDELQTAKFYDNGETTVQGVNDATKVAMAVSKVSNNSAEIDYFNEIVGAHLTDKPTSTVTAGQTGSAAFTDLAAGYYLVKDKNGSVTGDDSYTKYLVRLVDNADMNIKDQSVYLHKTIRDSNGTETANNAAIGDKVTYRLTSHTSTMDGYEQYQFIIHDELSGGLTFNPQDLKVQVDNADYANYKITYSKNGNDYVDTLPEPDGQPLYIKLSLNDLVANQKQDKDVVITYSATVNGYAVIGSEPNTNKARLEYSNNPNRSQGGASSTAFTADSTVYTYVAGFEINKVSPKGDPLPGAQFSISGNDLNQLNILGYAFVEDEKGPYYLTDPSYTTVAPNPYSGKRYAAQGDTTLQTGKTITGMTGDGAKGTTTGKLRFNGLKAGNYTVSEVLAPTGYKKLDNDIQLEIEWKGPDAGQTDCTWTYKLTSSGSEANAIQGDGTNGAFTILNQHGLTLPFTGGAGANLLAGLGLALMAAAAAAFIYIKRRRDHE